MDFGDALAADALCQGAADDAGLGGTYRAWISDYWTSPALRFTHPDAPYELVDGTPIADDWNDLVDGQLHSPIGRNELGLAVDPLNTYVVTATTAQGDPQVFNGNCDGWTDLYQFAGIGDVQDTILWSDSSAMFCSWSMSLYCFEQ